VLFFCFCLLELMFVFGCVCIGRPKEWCILNSVDYVVGIVACQVVVFVRNSNRESRKSELILSVQLDSINQK
jgi:hypothetical protein